MSWVTFVWGAVIGACLTMALPHLLVAVKRQAWENLLFAIAAMSVAGIACAELSMMHASTTEQIARAQQWTHVPIFVLVLAMAGFVRFYFGTGRLWLAAAACLARLGSLIINFAYPPNVNFREVTALRHLNFLGETVAMPEGTINPWTHLGELSSLLMLVFVIDASLALWRRGLPQDRRRAVMVGGSITLFIVLAAGLAALIHARVIHMPYLVSLPFLGVIAAMGFELSYETIRAAQTAQRLRVSEAALRESELRMSLAADAADLGLWLWNIPRDEIWITEKGRALFGFAESEPISYGRFLQSVHEEDRARLAELVQRSLERGDEYESECRIVQPGGRTCWVASYGRVEFDEHGRPASLRGVSRNITKRKIAEEALRESNARFRTVADAAPVMIWMSAPDKLCNFFNKGWLEFTGRTLEQELGNGWAEGVHREDVDRCFETYCNAFDARQPFTMEYRLHRKDGEYRWLLDNGVPRFDKDGTFLGYIGSCVDITEREQTELDHQLQSTELARVGRVALMGELAASLAHEVNNPIGAMVTNANAGQRLIASGQMDSEELRDLLADIVADGHRARQVIQGIRNMVRKRESTRALVTVDELIHDLLRIMRADSLERRVTLTAEIDSEAGRVLGDRVQLLQVLLNLTMNAFEALAVVRSDARLVVIRAGRSKEGRIFISVRDSGPGFPEGLVDRLFEPFFSTKAEGTGMGLAIARSIIEAHGGELRAENCEEGGARFTVQLPETKEGESRAA
jgi:two-component system, LuxR family, sensor kinase FixL